MNTDGPTMDDFNKRFHEVFEARPEDHPLGREMVASGSRRGVRQLLLDLDEAERHRKRSEPAPGWRNSNLEL